MEKKIGREKKEPESPATVKSKQSQSNEGFTC